MNAKSKAKAATAVLTDIADLATLLPSMGEVVPSATEPTPEPASEPANEPEKTPEPKFEQDAAIREAALEQALAEMYNLGWNKGQGGDALMSAGIRATEMVYDKVVNESHVESMYEAFARGNNVKAKSSKDRIDGADKSALSRFRTFFKPEVAAFIYGSGVNHNWHDTAVDIHEGIEQSNRKMSLYNSLVKFNRMVVDAKAAAKELVTTDAVEKAFTKDGEPQAKTLKARIDALRKSAEGIFKKGAPEFDKFVIAAIDQYLSQCPTSILAQVPEAE